MPSKELFLGNLGRDVTRQDIEGVFDKYGRVERCDIKNRGKLCSENPTLTKSFKSSLNILYFCR